MLQLYQNQIGILVLAVVAIYEWRINLQ